MYGLHTLTHTHTHTHIHHTTHHTPHTHILYVDTNPRLPQVLRLKTTKGDPITPDRKKVGLDWIELSSLLVM